MKVIFHKNSTITLEMTVEQLGFLRYTLNTGVEKLISDASFHKVLGDEYAKASKETADGASAVNNELEAAVQRGIS